MNKLPHYTIIAFLLCLFIESKAQLFADFNFKFKTYTTNDGLVHNSVKKCLTDSKGFLWIITENGLSRFDGYQFKNFQHINNDSTSLPANDIADIVIDKEDRVWLAYRFGLCYYNPANQHFTVLYNKMSQVPATQLTYIYDDDILLIISPEAVLKYAIEKKEFHSTSLNHKLADNPTCAMTDNKKNIWIGIEQGGYYVYNVNADTAHYFYDPESDTAIYFKTYEWPLNFYQSREGTIYMSTWVNAFKKVEPDGHFKNENTYRLPVVPVTGLSSIYRGCTESEPLTGKDILWVVTENGGVALFSKTQKKFVHVFRYKPELINGIKTDFNWSIYTGPDGTVWICNYQGISKVNKHAQQFSSEELPELNSSNYNCVTGLMDDPYDSDKVWMSVDGSGIAQFSKNNKQLERWYFHDIENAFKSKYYKQQWCVNLIKDSSNTIWGASFGGLVKIKKGQVSFIFTQDKDKTYPDARGIYKDKKNELWLFGDLLQHFNPYTEKYESWKEPAGWLANNTVYQFHDVADGTSNDMYIATNNGLFNFNAKQNIFKPIDFWKELPDSNVWKDVRVLKAIGSKLYIGTLRGVAEMDMVTKHCIVIGEKEQIARANISSLYTDALNKLWIYSNNGVFRYDPITHEILKFTQADGLYNNSNDQGYFFEYGKELFLGYRAAYSRFDPAQVNSNTNQPIPFITEIKAGGNYLSINTNEYNDKVLSLNYTQSNITFDFTAIEYNDPEKITFSYMLEGFDKNWIDAGNKRAVSYTNLPGGDFIFKVKAYNSSGIASDKIAIFKIKIIPPFWKTWWFFLLILLAVSLLSIGISRWIQKRKQELNKINEQVARVELASLRSQMNPHFIFNSLNSIHKYIWENKQDDASEYLTKFSKLVRMILENSKEKEIPLSKELESLQLYIELEHRRCNNKFDYSISVDPSINSANVLIPSMIIQPYVENAIWHGLVQAAGNGNLTINITQGIKQLTCIIEDNGIGRKKAAAIKAQKQDVHRSLGLDITQERLNLLSKESGVISSVQIIDIDDGAHTGTKVILQLPLNMLY